MSRQYGGEARVKVSGLNNRPDGRMQRISVGSSECPVPLGLQTVLSGRQLERRIWSSGETGATDVGVGITFAEVGIVATQAVMAPGRPRPPRRARAGAEPWEGGARWVWHTLPTATVTNRTPRHSHWAAREQSTGRARELLFQGSPGSRQPPEAQQRVLSFPGSADRDDSVP